MLCNNGNANVAAAADKRFKTLPTAETLPRDEVLGGYIFVCNNDTMQEDLKSQLFGKKNYMISLDPRYRDSIREITPGLPLFLYNYTIHQLHGIFEAMTFGGINIDSSAWEDKKCKGESRFPAQVRIRIRFSFCDMTSDGIQFRYHLQQNAGLELNSNSSQILRNQNPKFQKPPKVHFQQKDTNIFVDEKRNLRILYKTISSRIIKNEGKR
ncbi:DCD domain-containing protein NRP-B-like [Lactuca sativa]|uniref:DCD domain-containing protein NRP-B-like n=1 Tax=Lactuca sativa TaxID=4236 RepID=UPI000CD8B53A|nr:DCD domain-containing protein NRP-B-like [Lactuca sativa]